VLYSRFKHVIRSLAWQHKLKMLMWGDRLLDVKTMG